MESTHSIPKLKERGHGKLIGSTLAIIFVFMFHFILIYFNPHTIEVTSFTESHDKNWRRDLLFSLWCEGVVFTGILLCQFFNRLILYLSERQHISSRYGDNKKRLFEAVFGMRIHIFAIWTLFLIGLFISLFFIYEELQFKISFFHVLLLQFGISQWFATILLIKEPSTVEIDKYNEEHQSNIAIGLAVSYYYGYLRIILPEFVSRIKDPDNKIIVKKLIVLMPLSCVLNEKVADEDDPNLITPIDNPCVEPLIKHVAGIKRTYRNAVYLIKDPKKIPCCIITEYCTPLNTLKQLSDRSLTADEKYTQVLLFKKHIKKLIKNDSFYTNMCKLVIYDDRKKDFSMTGLLLDVLNKEEYKKAQRKLLN